MYANDDSKKYIFLFVYCVNSLRLLRLHNGYIVSKQVRMQLKSKQLYFKKNNCMYTTVTLRNWLK